MKKPTLGLLLLASLLAACQNQTTPTTTSEGLEESLVENVSSDAQDDTTAVVSEYYGTYKEEDFETDYDEASATTITFGTTTEISGEGATIDGNLVTITQGGTYVVTGTATNSQLKIKVADNEKVHLILAGVTIENDFGPAILIEEADKVITTLVDGTVNQLTDGETYTNVSEEMKEDAVFYSKADLTINGTGTLQVTGRYQNGLVSKDDLILISGTYHIDAPGDGIKGKDSVAIRDGNYTIATVAGDAIQSNNDTDSEKGTIALDGGTYSIEAGRDGIQAETTLWIQNATFDITTAQGIDSTDLMEEESYKGLKAGQAIVVTSGTFHLNTADDSLHANGDLTVEDGAFTIASLEDGLHADQTLTLSGGTIDITQSYEGVEATSIQFLGSDVAIVASDDGINATSSETTTRTGGSGAVDEKLVINVEAGWIAIDAQGDGLDSNGNITMSGGTLLVNGTNQGGNGALDYDGTFALIGGTMVAVGSADMAQNVSESSTQGTVALTFDQTQSASQTISLWNEETQEMLLAFTPIRDYQSVIMSSPDLIIEQSYQVHLGGTVTEDVRNGFVSEGSIRDSQVTTSFTLSETVSQLNQSGETISGQMMGGNGPRGNAGEGMMTPPVTATP